MIKLNLHSQGSPVVIFLSKNHHFTIRKGTIHGRTATVIADGVNNNGGWQVNEDMDTVICMIEAQL
jgi:hypothetical protein